MSDSPANGGTLGFGIDRGGTFTDVVVVYPTGQCGTFKLLSEDPQNYADAPTEAIRRILSEFGGQQIQRGQPISTEQIGWIRMGTTVATNALLERKGEPMALLITRGFKDLLHIGNQSRPKIFDFDIQIPGTLYEDVVEVDERVVLEDDSCQMQIPGARVRTKNGQIMIIEKPLDLAQVRTALEPIVAKGIRSLAVLLIHSYMFGILGNLNFNFHSFPDHEQAIGQLAREMGFANVSLSSQVIPMIKAVPRGFTSCADAYLTPIIQKYIQTFRAGFANNLEGVQLEFMQSDGGLCPVESFIGSRAILSGPAGGVVGVSFTAYEAENEEPVIGFDMGGTSTDVSRYAGHFSHCVDSITAGIAIQAPQLEVNTVAAGGGSRLFFRDGLFVVGPESAGSNPGPVCYRKGGHLTVTDANVVLGRILPEFFPNIFGPDERQPLDKEGSIHAFQQLTNQVNAHLHAQGRPPISVPECALGFIQVANESMCRPIRTLTEAKGFDTSRHVLSCFGGAGGQHACAIAKSLGMHRVKVHKYAGVLSAYGLVLADVVNEQQQAWIKPINEENFPELQTHFLELEQRSRQILLGQGFAPDQIHFERILHMRYAGTDCLLMCQPEGGPGDSAEQFLGAFAEQYKTEFGFTVPDRAVIVDDIRVRGIATRFMLREEPKQPLVETFSEKPPLKCTSKCHFEEGELDTAIFELSDLQHGHSILGPTIIIDKNCTILVEPNCRAEITAEGNVQIQLLDRSKGTVGTEMDPIQLSIFSHRFMSIAEQMGSVLQRSAISTNIKERLDFSCALFGPDGGLVANAPHIPVHLGGMQAAVRFQIEHIGLENFQQGDVILCNHPKAGGSHLPDLTVITPVFFTDSTKVPDFFVANRGHHSDIGGLVPGSMPPHSTHLDQEGATFVSFKIVDNGEFMEAELVEQLMAPGRVPGCSGTRNLRDNKADLNAQIAANQKGILLLRELVNSYTLPVVQAYMAHIQQNAEHAVRQLLRKVAKENRELRGANVLKAEDNMDDGTPIRLAVEIDENSGDAVFDFAGTGPQVENSCNTPPAVLMAAVIYCLRCMVGRDIPLNQGCLAPVKIRVPPGTILSPAEGAAVVGGNVLTSQRLCDVILRAFDAVAASQGCMNNVTFGDDKFGYYETVGGGAGAGPGFHGRSGVHTHMTNTRITDVEVLEQRYPIIVRRFHLRPNSGGNGKWRGGDGISRHLQFRRPLQVSLLTERRVFAPYGLHGGEPGKRGLNTLQRAASGERVNLGPKCSVGVGPGDVLELETPGGGGFGKAE